jgi:uncharacterized protein (TIGR03067 family)
MLRSTLAGLLLTPFMALGAEDDPAKVDREKLQGTWKVVKGYTANGVESSPEFIKEADGRTKFSGETMTNSRKRGQDSTEYVCIFTIDPGKTPKEIDMIIREGPPVPGIYRVEGNTLEIARSAGLPGPGLPHERPTTLGPCPKDSKLKWTYTVYSREKTP